MRNLSFAHKMAIIAGVFFIPIAVLVVVLTLEIKGNEFAGREQLGTTYARALRPLFADLESYRLASTGPGSARDAIGQRIDADFAAAATADAGSVKPLGLTAALATLQTKWAARTNIDEVISDYLTLLGRVSDNSEITLDPKLDGYYVGDTMVNKVPSLIDGIATAGEQADLALRDGRLAPDGRIALTLQTGQISLARNGIEHNIPIAIDDAPYLRAGLDDQRRDEAALSTTFAARLTSELLKPNAPHGDRAALQAAQLPALAAAFALYDATIAKMDDILQRRIDGLNAREAMIFWIVLVTLAAAAALMLATTRSKTWRSSPNSPTPSRAATYGPVHLLAAPRSTPAGATKRRSWPQVTTRSQSGFSRSVPISPG
jgi:methyl-accepting chemotaxis protein